MAREDHYNNHSFLDYFSFPIHFCFFAIIVLFVLGFSWYINYESAFEDMVIKLKICLMLVPLLLLLLVHCLSTSEPSVLKILPSEPDSLHRAGASPWGVAIVLLLLLFLISHQSSFHERWFPLVTRDH
ncbi:putative transmembrane protein [Senna tora]|uniref:Putative transmembrane protein n=1 Tax=Senna tora TaxID=362788 RepID=A0A834XGS0_9FABA|nr:putative transmembrane protein [Senna tora]